MRSRWVCCLSLLSCLLATIRPASGSEQLSQADVEQIIAQAATRAAQLSPASIIAVVDREGYILGVLDVSGNPNPNPQIVAAAISRAGTAAFLSSNQNAFTSRTAGYIIQQHFPPGIVDTPPGPLVGVGISSIFVSADKKTPGYHSDVNFMKQIPPAVPLGTFDPNGPLFELVNPFRAGAAAANYKGDRSPGTFGAGTFSDPAHTVVVPGTGAPGTSLNDSPGGVPLYKGGELVGGVGVTGDGVPNDISTGFAIIDAAVHGMKTQRNGTPGFEGENPDTDEDVALAGQMGYEPSADILATNVLIGGIRLPYVDTTTSLSGTKPFLSVGVELPGFPAQASPPEFNYPKAQFGGVDGEIRFPVRNDPMPGKIGDAKRLTAGEVGDIISKCAQRAGKTRAGIRLPLGTQAEVFITVVGNPNRNKVPPPILGVFRTGEATVFSWDVAVQKARTAFFFSNQRLAESTRTVGFLAQRFFPPGIDGNRPGPYFGLQEGLFIAGAVGHPNNNLPNVITVFPGGFPLYRHGVLVGAVGVSGDGVDQDDIIAASGTVNFLPSTKIEADQFSYRGARLPYAKFPRDPGL